MHSSRTRNVRCSGRPWGCLPVSGCLPATGVCLPRGCLPARGWGWGLCLPDCPLPVGRMTDVCKNITFPQGKDVLSLFQPNEDVLLILVRLVVDLLVTHHHATFWEYAQYHMGILWGTTVQQEEPWLDLQQQHVKMVDGVTALHRV